MKHAIKLFLIVVGVVAVMLPIFLTNDIDATQVQRTRVATRAVQRQADVQVSNVGISYSSSANVTYDVTFDLGSLKTVTQADLTAAVSTLNNSCPFNGVSSETVQLQYSQNGSTWSNISSSSFSFSNANYSARYLRLHVTYNGSLPGTSISSPAIYSRENWVEYEEYTETYWEEVPDPTPTPQSGPPTRGGGIQRR